MLVKPALLDYSIIQAEMGLSRGYYDYSRFHFIEEIISMELTLEIFESKLAID
jgi:hypothetical protein